MREVGGTAERPAKRMRYTARALAVFWVALVAFGAAGLGLLGQRPYQSLSLQAWLTLGLLVLIPCVTTAVAWRWEAIGGALLVAWGVIVIAIAIIDIARFSGLLGRLSYEEFLTMATVMLVYTTVVGIAGVSLGLPPLAAGALFLVSWRKSRAPTGALPNSQ